MRHLSYVLGSTLGYEGPVSLVLCNEDGTVHYTYQHIRSFRRIERHGEWWRLAGRDSETGEIIYLREQAVA